MTESPRLKLWHLVVAVCPEICLRSRYLYSSRSCKSRMQGGVYFILDRDTASDSACSCSRHLVPGDLSYRLIQLSPIPRPAASPSSIFDCCVTRGANILAWPSNWLRGLHVPQIKARSQSSGQPCHSVMSSCMGQRKVSATLAPVSFAWRPKYWVPAVPLAAAVAETPILAVRFTVNRYLSGGGTYSGVRLLNRSSFSLSPLLSFFLFFPHTQAR